MLAEMSGMQAGNDEFMSMMGDLRDAVEHHVEEEENELFPQAEQILGDSRLQEMGQQMMQMKQGKSATATQKANVLLPPAGGDWLRNARSQSPPLLAFISL